MYGLEGCWFAVQIFSSGLVRDSSLFWVGAFVGNVYRVMESTCFVLVMSLLRPWLVSAFLLLGLPAIAAPPSAEEMIPPGRSAVIPTPQGLIRGAVRNGVIDYRGIPYARKPERWSPARPVPGWAGVRDGGNFGPACPQQARFNLTEASSEEDCLSVNVSRPLTIPPGRRLPVFVWIHGGAFVGGGSNLYRLDALASQGMVVVTMNYRVGVLGFMPHPAFDLATNGNIGLLDQREALRWVQRNIAAFGGDPTNVTVGGESAGAGSICMHLAAPEFSRGLFHKAFVMSGACLQPLPTVQDYSTLGTSIATAVGCPQTEPTQLLACLRAKPLVDPLDSTKGLLAAGAEATQGRTMSFGPSIGASLATPRSMADAIAQGKVHNVPLLMGGARDELRLYVGYDQQSPKPITPANYAKRLVQHYTTTPDTPLGQRILARYPLTDPRRAPESLGSVISHYNPNVGINNCLYLHTASSLRRRIGQPIYSFEFADPDAVVLGVGIAATPDPQMEFGAVHSSGLNYLFPQLSNTSRIDAPDLLAPSKPLATQMQQMVASFATQGVPSASGLPTWPVFSNGPSVMRLIPGQTALYDAGVYHGCSFWRELFPNKLS
jgi:para-nitrobenzyl esterase